MRNIRGRSDAPKIKEQEDRLRLRALLLCAYATVWGMGGHLSGEASRISCSDLIRQVFSSRHPSGAAWGGCDLVRRAVKLPMPGRPGTNHLVSHLHECLLWRARF